MAPSLAAQIVRRAVAIGGLTNGDDEEAQEALDAEAGDVEVEEG